jgi:hypothetical protein
LTNLLQALEQPETPAPTGNVDYVAWATEKFKTADGTLDVAALARGKWESDTTFVPRILTELQEARKEAQTRASLEDFIEDYRSQRPAQINTPVITPVEPQPNTSSITQADIDKIVDARLSSKQREQVAQSNIKTVQDTLRQTYGDQAVHKVKARAEELGLSSDDVTALAAKSPKAFLDLVLDKAPASPPVAPGTYIPPRTNVNTVTHINTSSAKSKKQWNDARRTMKASEYWTPEVQNQILADMVTLGDKFNH